MTHDGHDLERALKLPPAERMKLAGDDAESEEDSDLSPEWREEIKRRIKDEPGPGRPWPGRTSPTRRLCVPALLTMLVGCASAPAEGPAPRADGGEPAWSRIAREVGVPRLTMEIETDEVARQEALGGKVGFEAAFRAALESLLHGGGDLESPVAIFRNGADRILGEDEAREMARRAIDQPTSRLALVRLTPPGREDDPDHPHRPQGGEDMREHWVFHLVTKETHDHSHWAVVPRDGRAVFNYGFN